MRCVPRLLLTAILLGVGAGSIRAQERPPTPCEAPEAQQFDFWLGTWDLTWEGGTGTNTVTRILGDCIIQEDFATEAMGPQPYLGLSVSAYSPQRGQWRQTWVDSQGGYLDFVGGFADGKMVLQREGMRNGKPVLQRMTWYNITPDSLDWDWEASEDGGQTWTLNWQIHYTRRR